MSLLQKLDQAYTPSLMIAVYKATSGEDKSANYYLESHQVNAEGKVMEGKPLLQETIQEIVDLFFDDQKDRSIMCGIVPETLLQYKPQPGGKYRLVWYNPPQVRMIHFAKQLKLVSNRMWFPGLVYVVDRDELSIYAMKQGTRPNEKTKFFRAPFHNVSDSGNVCLGTAKVRKPVDNRYESVIKYWEDLFWLSEFSHLNGAKNPTKSPLGKVYRKMLASKMKMKWTDSNELREIKTTIKSILR